VIARVVGIAGLAILSVTAVPTPAAGQSGFHPRWERPGFDFRKDGVWRARARRVAEVRRSLLARGRLAELNAPVVAGGMAPTQVAITGSLNVPFVLITYPGIDSVTFMRPQSEYTALLFGASPPGALPYSLNSFYQQLSNGLFGMTGTVTRWAHLANAEVTYTGTPSATCQASNPFGSTNCNGIFSSAATNQMQIGLREALVYVDTGAAGINFAQFDNDGPDGTPNSGDDDGFVDLVLFAHATQDGSCGGSSNNHIWAHRFALVTGVYTTNDASAEGGNIRVSDYLIQSALGGSSGCDVSGLMPIGVAAHELGHGLGLPDLYDIEGITQGPSVGIGRWGLMGMGSEATSQSPARMEAWSLNEMGWVALDTLTTSGTYSFSAAPVSDTAFVVRVQGTNTRGEYFLLENRQASQADTALIRVTCARSGLTRASCDGGLLIWHVDSVKAALSNGVNHGPIHGLALKQADGFRNLEEDEVTGNICAAGTPVVGCSDRGDAGDPYPGTANNTLFSFRTNPAARKNLNDDFVGFAIDQVNQLVQDGELSFRLRFGALSVVRASDTSAVIQFEGANFNVFRDLLDDGASYDVSVADTQLSANGRTRFRFVSWSDGGARTHTITGSVLGDTIVANLARDFKLIATATAGGSVAADTTGDLTAGLFIPQGRAVELTATAGAEPFAGWTGDTVTTNAVIVLPMGRPYTVTAVFGSFVITTPASRPNGVMGAAYHDTLRVSGGTGTNSWSVTGGALPLGVTLGASNGVLSGFPRQTGTFTYEATVVSGSQSEVQTFTFDVNAPTLATADVVAHLLGPGVPLTADHLRYLDFLGNNNSVFDIGDFLAWVKATGAP
jgi:M6 family metalloprotease-like protein